MRTPSPLCESRDRYPQNLSSSLLLCQIDATIRPAGLRKRSDEILHIKLPRREWLLLLETTFKIQVLKGNYIVSFIPRSGKHYCPVVMKEKKEERKKKKERKEGREETMISLSITKQNHLSTPATVPPAVPSWKGNSDRLPPFVLPSYTVFFFLIHPARSFPLSWIYNELPDRTDLILSDVTLKQEIWINRNN